VWDIAAAHLAALGQFDELLAGPATSAVINLGTGTGTTVRELLDAFNSVADPPVPAVETGRRPGDVAGAYTRSDRAAALLGWRAQYSIAEGIRHSLQWAAVRDEILAR
jgi:UDP-glucose 4-epimerase